MSIKTILLHLNDERRVAGLVDVAAHLATRHEAHLIGLYVMPPVPTLGATSIGASLIKSGLAQFRAEAKRVETAFEAASKGRPFLKEWRLVDPKRQGVAETSMAVLRISSWPVSATDVSTSRICSMSRSGWRSKAAVPC